MRPEAQKIITSEIADKSTTEIADSVLSFMGPKLAAYIAGEPDGAESIATTSQEVDDRLAIAYAMIAWISSVDSRQTTLAWFVGRNPYLGETAPASAVRDGKFMEATAAAKNFVNSG